MMISNFKLILDDKTFEGIGEIKRKSKSIIIKILKEKKDKKEKKHKKRRR